MIRTESLIIRISIVLSLLYLIAPRCYASVAGQTASDPIVLPSGFDYFKSVATANPLDWGYTEDPGKEKGVMTYFSVDLPEQMSLIVHTYGSELLCTGIEIIGPGYATVLRSRDAQTYYKHISKSPMWDPMTCTASQDCYIAFDLPAGKYEIRAFGKRYFNANPVNGPIKLTVIGFGINTALSPEIPLEFIPGTPIRPFKLGYFIFDFAIEECWQFKEGYLLAHHDRKAWYEIEFNQPMNIEMDVPEHLPPLTITGDSTGISYTVTGNVSFPNMPPGRYLIQATLSDSMLVHFSISGTIPPPPPDPDLYEEISLYDSSVVGRNYIETKAFTDSAGTYNTAISHVDGLGRPVQTIQVAASPDGRSIADRIEYDSGGKQSKVWMPTAITTGSPGHYVSIGIEDYSEVYGDDSRVFTSYTYESSMLSRPLSVLGPGSDWAADSADTRYSYDLNAGSGTMACICFSVSDTPGATSQSFIVSCEPSEGGSIYYLPGELSVVRTIDEDGNTLITFTDPDNHEILQRRLIDGAFADTYYIYDSYGNLTAVLPPELSTSIAGATTLTLDTDGLLDRYAYLYRYDNMGNLVAKKLPGCGWIEYRHDLQGHIVMWRDGNLRAQGRYRFELCDMFGRVCLKGTCRAIMITADITPENENSTILFRVRRCEDGAAESLMGYEPIGCSLIDPQIMEAYYYDDYSFVGYYGFPAADVMGFKPFDGYGEPYGNARGRLTGHAVATEEADSIGYLFTATYYDSRNRVIQAVATNHLGGTNRVLSAYDFVGHEISTKLIHTADNYSANDTAREIIQQWQRQYDAFGRELAVLHSIDGSEWQLLAARTYDAIGRLATESAGDPEVANRVYEYDIRSHPISISSYGYSQQLSFTYGGNVSAMTWKAYGPAETEHTYRFEYDGLSRLVAARHSDSDGHSGLYDTSYTYDLNGNITSLTRSGLYDSSPYGNRYGSIDNLTYEYSGNQVTRISDLCTGPFYQGAYHFRDGADEEVEYAYDANGNMTMDLNRGITSISYDINQRPRSVVFDSGASTSYLYSADGVKLQTRHHTPTLSPAAGMGVADESTEESVTDYCGPFIYEDGELARINFENGYLSYRSYSGQKLEVPEYVFYLRDHLGNNRVTMSANGGIYQIDHFYPFGLPMGCSYNSSHQQWRFGGKEFDRTAGLDLYDFEARAYDPSTARFTCPDPLAEKYNPLSPYLFCAANPLILIDPTGMKFTESAQYWVDQLTSFANQQIENNQSKISSSNSLLSTGLITDDLAQHLKSVISQSEAQIAELNAMKEEFAVLDASDQIYDVTISDKNGDNMGETRYNHSNGYIEMILPTNPGLGLVAHEFKHAYQFEMGQYGETYHRDGYPIYDYTDEVEAYNRSTLISGTDHSEYLENYKFLQKGPASVRTWLPTQKWNDTEWLQKRAKSMYCIFRWCGKTYVGTPPN